MYHRVEELDYDPWGVAVTPDRFAQQLQCLRNFGTPTSLERVVKAARGHELSRPAIAVTFDDGYADNLHNAAPLLKRYDVPATVFVATGYIGAAREFWWDELEKALLTEAELPSELRLAGGELRLGWSLGAARTYSERNRSADRIWFNCKQGEPSPRFAFFRQIHQHLMSLGEHQRRSALDQIVAWSGACSRPRPSNVCMTHDQAIALNRFEHVDLGAHTVTHAALPALSPEAQALEIRESKKHVEALTGRPTSSFAYPYGLYSDEIAKLVGEEKFASACTTRPGVVAQGCDLYSLPRIKVGDWDRERFENTLAKWLAV